MRRYAALVVSVTVVLVLFPSLYECTAGDHPDKLQILSLLEKRDFTALDRLLATLQENSEKDISKEVDVQLAFEAFATSRPELEPLLNEWITKRPKSYPAQLAAGEYFSHLGWEKRGSKWAEDTSEEQFKQMNAAFAQSIRYVGAALSLHPALIEGYAVLMNIEMARGESETEEKLTRQALERVPASFRIRRSHLAALLPRWGGSYEAMESFARESQAYATQNPKLKRVRGFMAWDLGRVAVGKKDYGLAVQF